MLDYYSRHIVLCSFWGCSAQDASKLENSHEIGHDVTAASFMFCVWEQNGFLAVLSMYFLSLVARMIRHQGYDGILKANNCIRFKQNRLAWENGLLCSLLYYLSNHSVTFSNPYKLACLDLDLHIQVDFLDNIVQVVIQQYCIVESQLNHSWIIELVIHVLRVW